MVDWIARLRHRRRQRTINQTALQVVSEGQGVAARTWPLPPAITPPKLGAIRAEAHAWLAANIAVAASPYGWSECSVLVALACSVRCATAPALEVSPPAISESAA